MKVIFASNNSGKIRELQSMLSQVAMQIIPQSELQVSDIPETGLTFVENALLKARHACEVTGLPAIADDSGLIVDALQGAPGIFSARYAGENASSQDNIKKLLNALGQTPEKNRSAAFFCVLVYLAHAEDPAPIICQGIWHGMILDKPTGTDGFGYDPVFYDMNEKCSAAQMPLELKNKISHRGQALRMLIEKLMISCQKHA